MKKRIISLFLTIAMVVGMLPQVAAADSATELGLWVGGVKVTESNADHITGINIRGYVSYDMDTNILHLKDANITAAVPEDSDLTYALGIHSTQALNIQYRGDNFINGNASAPGISAYGDLLLKGDLNGTLSASGSVAIKSDTGNITLEDGSIRADGNGSFTGTGIFSGWGEGQTGNIYLRSGAWVYATGTSSAMEARGGIIQAEDYHLSGSTVKDTTELDLTQAYIATNAQGSQFMSMDASGGSAAKTACLSRPLAYINGVPLTREYSYWVNGASEAVAYTTSWNATLVGDTVHLMDAEITQGYTMTKGVATGETAGVYLFEDADLLLSDENDISGCDYGVYSDYALYIGNTGNARISGSLSSIRSGSGDLTITSEEDGENSYVINGGTYGLRSGNDIFIRYSTLTITATQDAIHAGSTKSVHIEDGTLDLTSTGEDGCGIYAGSLSLGCEAMTIQSNKFGIHPSGSFVPGQGNRMTVKAGTTPECLDFQQTYTETTDYNGQNLRNYPYVSVLRESIPPHTHDETTFEIPWTATDSLPAESGSYVLENDVALTTTWKPADGTKLCLNGHSISGVAYEFALIAVDPGVHFCLDDCQSTGTLTKGAVAITLEGTVEMYGGTIIDNSYFIGGGVQIAKDGVFHMYGGAITQNSAGTVAGGVYNEGTFILEGGSITANTSPNGGGGGVYNVGTFRVVKGNISKNTATEGGGVANTGSFTMVDGSICDNTASSGGGVANTGTFTLEGGSITGNIAQSSAARSALNGVGGGVINNVDAQNNTGKLLVSGGSIMGNTAQQGGGVYVCVDTGITLSGQPQILDNAGGDLHLSGGQTATADNLSPEASIGISVEQPGSFLLGDTQVGSEVFFSRNPNYQLSSDPATGNLTMEPAEGVHMHSDGTVFSSWVATDSLPVEAGLYYLENDVTISERWKPVDGIHLCLNGHSIIQLERAYTIVVDTNTSLDIYDCQEQPGKITHAAGVCGSGVSVMGHFTLHSGSISGNRMDTGRIGGVYVYSGSFTMNGGSITQNETSSEGGGVYLLDGTFRMNGGSITGNTAAYGGGVYKKGGTMILSGSCSIEGNTATTMGSNLTLDEGQTVTVEALSQNTTIGVSCIGRNAYDERVSAAGTVSDGDASASEGCFFADDSSLQLTTDSAGKLILAEASSSHQHNWSYTVSDIRDTVTAQCLNEGCDYQGTDTSLTIYAPTLTTEGGSGSAQATLSAETLVGEPVSAADIQYSENALVLEDVPTTAGSYAASYYLSSGESIHIRYTIAPASQEATFYDLWVGGTQVSSENSSQNGLWNYDPATATLTIHGSGSVTIGTQTNHFAIYAQNGALCKIILDGADSYTILGICTDTALEIQGINAPDLSIPNPNTFALSATHTTITGVNNLNVVQPNAISSLLIRGKLTVQAAGGVKLLGNSDYLLFADQCTIEAGSDVTLTNSGTGSLGSTSNLTITGNHITLTGSCTNPLVMGTATLTAQGNITIANEIGGGLVTGALTVIDAQAVYLRATGNGQPLSSGATITADVIDIASAAPAPLSGAPVTLNARESVTITGPDGAQASLMSSKLTIQKVGTDLGKPTVSITANTSAPMLTGGFDLQSDGQIQLVNKGTGYVLYGSLTFTSGSEVLTYSDTSGVSNTITTAEGRVLSVSTAADGTNAAIWDGTTSPISYQYMAVTSAVSHSHSWDTAWSSDETGHWHECTASGCDISDYSTIAESGYSVHTFQHCFDDNTHWMECTVCHTLKAETTAAHTYTNWKSNGDGTHTGKCACGKDSTQDCSGGTANCTSLAVCASCAQPYGQKDNNRHIGSAQWTFNDTSHTKIYDCCGATEVPEAPHNMVENSCTACGYQRTTFHIQVSCNSNHGTAWASPTEAAPGTLITLNAQASEGYHLEGWESDAADVTITDNTFLMPAQDVTITAVFAQHSYGPWQPSDELTHTATCACGATKTESCDLLPATCQSPAICQVCQSTSGEKNPGSHVSDTLTYTDNGDGVSHTVAYPCCAAVQNAAEAHSYVEGSCICGALEPDDREYVEIQLAVGETATATQNGLSAALTDQDITIGNWQIVSVTVTAQKKTSGGWWGWWSSKKTTYDHTITFEGLEAGTTVVQVGDIYYKVTVTEPHVHSYTGSITEPTCTDSGYTTYTCDCGDSYIGDYVDALGHRYENGVCIHCGQAEPQKPSTFTPSLFRASLSKTSAKVGQSVSITVQTSVDVEYVTINGVKVTNYSGTTTCRTFTYKVDTSTAGTYDYEIYAYNADDTQSTTAKTLRLTVKKASFGWIWW